MSGKFCSVFGRNCLYIRLVMEKEIDHGLRHTVNVLAMLELSEKKKS